MHPKKVKKANLSLSCVAFGATTEEVDDVRLILILLLHSESWNKPKNVELSLSPSEAFVSLSKKMWKP